MEREEGQSRGPDPFLSLQGLLSSLQEANCVNTTQRCAASGVRPANAGKNSRHGITVAVGGPPQRGQDGQAATPAAHVQTREHFGTGPKETDSSKNVKKNTEGRLWGPKTLTQKINNSN